MTRGATPAGAATQDATAAAGVLPRRFLRPLLLLALTRHEQTYGYQLAETLRGYGLNTDMAGVYRELRAMENHDLLDSIWAQSENGPDRRVYQLTHAGQSEATIAIEQLGLARDLLSLALADRASGQS